MRRLALLLAGTGLVASLALGGPAWGATSFVVGSGNRPHVAVDAAGTAHVAWDEQAPFPDTDPLHYCQIPRGQQSCAGGVRTFTLANEATAPAQVLIPGPNRVQLVAFRFGGGASDGMYVFESSDGGATFAAPRLIGTETVVNDAVAGPGESVSVAGGNPGVQFQNAGLAPPLETSEIRFDSSFLYDVTVGLDGATPVVVGWEINNATDVNNAAFYRYNGTGDVNSAASWTGPTVIAPLQDTTLAGGPSGLFLMAQSTSGLSSQNPYTVRRWDGSTFAPAGRVSGTDDSNYESDLFQDTSGGLHAVWRLNDSPDHRLRYARSTNSGVTWSTPVDVLRSNALFNHQVSVAPDGGGFVVWDGAGGGANNEIRVAPIELGPVLGKTVSASVVRGTVLVATPTAAARAAGRGARASQKGLEFVPLTADRQIPVGSFLDTKRGTVELVSATGSGSNTQAGQFSAGVFQVLQSRKRSAKGLTELRLKGSSFNRCRARGSAAGRAQAAQLSRRTIRRLRANAKGRFRTRGRHSAATVRGTVWITADRCDGTLTTVKRGKVAVRDLRRKRTVTLRAGKSYLARPRG